MAKTISKYKDLMSCSKWEKVSSVRGQSMFEVMFALVIASMVLIGIVSLAATSVRNAGFSKNKAQADKYAQEVVEWLKTERETMGWGDNSSGFYHQVKQSTVWCMDVLLWTGNDHVCGTNEYIASTIFKRYFTWTENPDALEFNVFVDWSDGNGDHNTTTTTVLTNWF